MRASTASVINPFASSAAIRRSFMTAISSSHSWSLSCRRGAILFSSMSISYAGTGRTRRSPSISSDLPNFQNRHPAR